MSNAQYRQKSAANLFLHVSWYTSSRPVLHVLLPFTCLGASQDLEAMLAELMRRSEEIMGRVEQQRHQERALPARLGFVWTNSRSCTAWFLALALVSFAGFALAARQRAGQPREPETAAEGVKKQLLPPMPRASMKEQLQCYPYQEMAAKEAKAVSECQSQLEMRETQAEP